MSELGQTEKNLVRANVFRFALELGHCPMKSALRICAISRHRAHGGAELRWNADTFAEMHRSIAVAACEE
jgi:hypothetical protein